MYVTSEFTQLCLLKFLCKSDHFPRTYRRKQKWVFSIETQYGRRTLRTWHTCIRLYQRMIFLQVVSSIAGHYDDTDNQKYQKPYTKRKNTIFHFFELE